MTRGIVERVKGFEEDDSVARETAILSPTDGKPLRETLRGYKSQDGEFMLYKVIGGRRMEESEIAELVEKRQVGPLDGFISARTRSRFAAILRLVRDEEKGKWQAKYDFGEQQDIGALESFWKDPGSGAELCESGNSYILREREGEAWKQSFRVGRLMCQKSIPREAAVQLVTAGKTDLIQGFISKKGRPFDAFLKREGAKIAWEFPPRKAKLDKDGNPIARKAKTPPDLSKAVVIGPSKSHKNGELVETPEAYYVRRPDQDNRVVFTLKRQLCGIDIPVEEVKRLCEDGRTGLIEGLVGKSGRSFSAYLKLSPTGAKADFEFPPR
jgi:DNA topoisomerase-3